MYQPCACGSGGGGFGFDGGGVLAARASALKSASTDSSSASASARIQGEGGAEGEPCERAGQISSVTATTWKRRSTCKAASNGSQVPARQGAG